ncbi:hypothetical protein TMEN_3256 [Trichophyton mentagrophytes]|nr:hypothetical protein TMEN_3256 [Trichophyton mentagrophytes]
MTSYTSDDCLLKKFATRHIHECGIGIGRPEFFTPKPRPDEQLSIGTLDRLPVELLHDILYMLDLESLSALLYVSRGANVAVNALPMYRAIVTHVPHLIEAIRRADLESEFTVQGLYKVLRTRDCPECGEFGGFIFLLTGERCCQTCLDVNQNFWALPIEELREEILLPPEDVPGLVVMKVVPGNYYADRVDPIDNLRLVSLREAVKLVKSRGIPLQFDMITCLGRESGCSFSVTEAQSCRCKFGPERRNEAPPEQPRYKSRIPPMGYPVWLNMEFNIHFVMSSVRLPYLSPDGTVDWGFFCDRCMYMTKYPYLLPEDEFLKHVRVCEPIKDYFERNREIIRQSTENQN